MIDAVHKILSLARKLKPLTPGKPTGVPAGEAAVTVGAAVAFHRQTVVGPTRRERGSAKQAQRELPLRVQRRDQQQTTAEQGDDLMVTQTAASLSATSSSHSLAARGW